MAGKRKNNAVRAFKHIRYASHCKNDQDALIPYSSIRDGKKQIILFNAKFMSYEWSQQASNSNSEKQKRDSAVSKIINAPADQEQKIKGFLKETFKNQEMDKFEREKTQEESNMINVINNEMKDFVKNYGGTFIEIPPQNIHVIDAEKLPNELRKKYFEKEEISGFYKPRLQGFVVFPSLIKEKTEFIKTLVHEMLHFNSFQSIKLIKGKLQESRVGFNVYSYKNNKVYFNELDEAIISELTIKFCEKILSPEESQQIKNNYINVSNYLWSGIDDLYFDNKQRFKNKEAVFNMLASSVFTGKLWDFARILVKTYGKDRLRYVAENTAKNIEDEIETK